jgi:glutamine amidotransferase
MCRLFGLLADGEVELTVSLLDAPPKFHAQGHTNPDGWGVGWYRDGEAGVIKHELPAAGALSPEQGSFHGSASLFLSHVRRSSRAPRALKNCHPFQHGGWLFAHNGAIHPLLEKWLRKSVAAVQPVKYEGQTESEALFRWLLLNIEQAGGVEAGVRAAVAPLIADGQFSSLNFLLARAGELYAFRYATRSLAYYSIYFLTPGAGGELDATSEDVHAHLRTRGLADRRAALIATEKLTAGPWQLLELGHLLSVKADLSVTVASVV